MVLNPPIYASISISFEWAMNDFSSGFHPPAVPGHETKLSAEEKQPAARCEWDFSLATVVSSTANATVSDTLGVIEFDPSNTILATGGIARKIRIYTLNSLLRPQEETVHFQGEHQSIAFLDHTNASGNCIFTPAKLSSLRWKPGTGGRILGSGDYDGVVMEYDVETKVPIFERGGSVAKVQPTKSRSSVCCVEFNPFGDALIAAGCADQKAYAYDVRKMVEPVHIFDGHTKTITYVRFLNAQTLVSAGTDGCLKLWNIVDSRLLRTYKGHVNSRSFVGLSVWRHGGLLGCGSENNQVFVYDTRWGEPIWVHGFEPMGRDSSDHHHAFVSSVCWRQVNEDQCTLVAGGSNGVLHVFVGKRKSDSE
ncbi:hypothetical protein Gotri_025655 [Gossypium trilobum]|uniref:Anaphase-promoting complex subunit 4 WD40 domain-containing protein n=1 Tax=Gossypium trilobum TaxID=34281 RepID=A0A7J9FNI6_9ROSI|nr:hypothetical protein [Gossypium trilobum]